MNPFFKKPWLDFSKGKKTPLKTAIVGVVGAIGVFYLLNPFGISLDTAFDNFPFIGNLDEVTAAMFVLASLKYFGIDLINLFTGNDSSDEKSPEKNSTDEPRYEPPTK